MQGAFEGTPVDVGASRASSHFVSSVANVRTQLTFLNGRHSVHYELVVV